MWLGFQKILQGVDQIISFIHRIPANRRELITPQKYKPGGNKNRQFYDFHN